MLKESDSEKISFFTGEQIAHRKLQTSYDDVRYACENEKPGSIITLLGPTGVGKTTLVNKLKENIENEFIQGLEDGSNDTGHIPIVLVEAPATDRDFDWKDFYHRLLEKLHDPIPGGKIDYSKWEPLPNDITKIMQRSRQEAGLYRRTAEKAVKFRSPQAIIIDEAQHIGKVSSGKKLVNQLDAIKSLASETNTRYVLCGTYELLNFVNLSDQLSRRSGEIHFQRYLYENESDIKTFKSILWQFQLRLPVVDMPDLVNKWGFFYERSLGCTGILSDWLEKALRLSLKEKAATITDNHIEVTALSVDKCQTIINAIKNGEERLEQNEEKSSLLRKTLGLEQAISKTKTPKHNKGNRNPGVRNPTRDAVGIKVA